MRILSQPRPARTSLFNFAGGGLAGIRPLPHFGVAEVTHSTTAVMDHPRVSKRLRSNRPKAVRFTPGSKALGGDWSQRQGQQRPLATLQPVSLANAFSHEEVVQEEVVQERTNSLLLERDVAPSPQVDEPRATGPGNAGTPELSTAVQLLPRTPHFAAIARAAAGSRLEDSDLPHLARSELQPDSPSETESPLRRIREAAARVVEQLHDLDAATSKITPPPQADDGAARQGTATAAPQISTGGGSSALPTSEHIEANSDGPSRAGASSAALPSCAAASSAHSANHATPSGGQSTPPVHSYSPTLGYSATHARRPIHSANGSVVPVARSMPLEGREPAASGVVRSGSVGPASAPHWVWRFA